MSYDVDMVQAVNPCPTCGRCDMLDAPESLNPTYNLTPIFDFALTAETFPNPEVSEGAVVLLGQKTDRPRGLRILSGRKAMDTVELLRNALASMNDPAKHEAFTVLEPENGWGDLDGARSTIEKMIENAMQYPDHVWSIR